MKETAYAEIICREFCKFYKEGKEEIHCGGYELLRANLTCKELSNLLGYISKKPYPQTLDEMFMEFICSKCDFKADGCDFKVGISSPPCGGYIIISRLFSYFSELENQP